MNPFLLGFLLGLAPSLAAGLVWLATAPSPDGRPMDDDEFSERFADEHLADWGARW